jgi:hypothetical protein
MEEDLSALRRCVSHNEIFCSLPAFNVPCSETTSCLDNIACTNGSLQAKLSHVRFLGIHPQGFVSKHGTMGRMTQVHILHLSTIEARVVSLKAYSEYNSILRILHGCYAYRFAIL